MTFLKPIGTLLLDAKEIHMPKYGSWYHSLRVTSLGTEAGTVEIGYSKDYNMSASYSLVMKETLDILKAKGYLSQDVTYQEFVAAEFDSNFRVTQVKRVKDL